MNQIHMEFTVIFSEIEFFESIFTLQVKEDGGHTRPPRRVAYMLQEPLKEELNILVPLGVPGTSDWCNNFIPVATANSKTQLYLELARLKKQQKDM